MMGYYYTMGPGMGYFGWMFMIVFWILLIFLIVWLVSLNRQPRRYDAREDALDVLKLRYAHGEITKKEYEAMRRDLQR